MMNLQKIFAAILILVIIVMLVSGIAFFFSKDKTDVSFNPIVDTRRLGDEFAKEVAEWKTYSNEQFGLEIKYPSAWQNQTQATDATHEVVQFLTTEASDSMVISIWKNDSSATDVLGQSVTISGKNAIDTGWTSAGIGSPLSRKIKFLTTSPITIEMNSGSELQTQNFEKVLATLRFAR